MGKFRSKLKGLSKGKRWPKGQSSSSNPETRKYRDAAKTNFFQINTGASNLTSDALRKHDALQSFNVNEKNNKKEDEMSIEDGTEVESTSKSTYRTMDTFASDWSACSNQSFSKLIRIFRSDSALHKEMLAVLAAVTEVIKAQGGSETTTEYYAALMTTLETAETEESVAAILSLLAMGLKSVPQSVLRSQFNIATNVYIELLTKYASCDNNVITRSLLTCISIFLRAQEQAVWGNSSTFVSLDAILAFVIHPKPKVRKAAQHSLCTVLTASCFMLQSTDENNETEPLRTHPGAAHVAQFCIHQIESSIGSSGGQTTTLHILSMLKDIIHVFPKAQIKSTCETILKIMTLNKPFVNSYGLQVIHSLFSAQYVTVPATINDQIILALYDYQPAVSDPQSMLAWLAVMKQAHVHLADIDITLAMKRLPRILQTLLQIWLTENSKLASAVTQAVESLVVDCIGAVCAEPEKAKVFDIELRQCFAIIEQGLGFQYHLSWKFVLYIMEVIFKTAGGTCKEMLKSYLSVLSSLRDSHKFSYNNELEHAVGAAVRTMGPEIVLEAIPLAKQGEMNIDRSWLLPVLKDNVQKSTLAYFNDHIRPLAEKCERKSKQLFEQKNTNGAHIQKLYSIQLWALFPSFCNSPLDLSTTFKKIAQNLGIYLTNAKDLRIVIMAGLRKLINFALETEEPSNKQEMSRFAKNYIPILLNLYTVKPNGTDEEGQRSACFDTLKVYFTIAPGELLQTIFTEGLKRLSSADDSFLRESLYDIIRLLAVYQNKDELKLLYEQCIMNQIKQNTNAKEQKKAYRLLENICASDSEGCKGFISNNKQIKPFLLNCFEFTISSSKTARMRCLRYIISKTITNADIEMKIIKAAITESILCMKDISKKCRFEAQTLLLTVGEMFMKNEKTYQKFIDALIAGFAGDQNLVVGTILAFTTCLHNFSGSLGVDNLKFLLETVCNLIQSSIREVAYACLGFLKLYIISLPIGSISEHLPVIVSSISQMSDDCKSHYRIKIGYLLDRLIKKFTYETIAKLLPSSDEILHKKIRNLRKLQARKKRVKEESNKESEEDDDNEFLSIKAKPKTIDEILADSDSDDEMETNEPKKTSKKSETWIEENLDSIVDFTDASAISKIRASNPYKKVTKEIKEKKEPNRGFQTAPDGRLIITEDSDSDSESKNKHNIINFNSDSEDDNDETKTVETFKIGGNRGQKRKRSDAESIKSGSTAFGPSTSKYKAGGSGIHRPVDTKDNPKTKGDKKKPGQLDPYAYLPLKRATLNKRKRLKNAGQFKNIVRGVNKGARKGLKAKRN